MRFPAGAFLASALAAFAAALVAACSAANFTNAPCATCTEAGTTGDAGIDRASAAGDASVDSSTPFTEASVPDSPSTKACPNKGGDMVRVGSGAVDFCVDRIEVTGTEYNKFYQTAGKVLAPSLNGPGCVKTSSDPPPMGNDVPVTQVDWCDAYAFCKWAGKRLCGHIGGGALTTAIDRGSASKNEWLHACSNGGSLAYPYGATFQASLCNGSKANSSTAPIAWSVQNDKCIGGFAGLFDMSGNVGEWIDACGGFPTDNTCAWAGGSFKDGPANLACASENTSTLRSALADNVGIRCCAD